MKRWRSQIILSGAFLLICFPLWSQNVGINTETPEATLDVNGDIIFRTANISIGDSVEQELDVNSFRYSYYRISGPTGDFDISGITAGVDGRLVTLFNTSYYAMILHNQDADVPYEDQIVTGTGQDLVVHDRSMVTLVYDGYDLNWIVKSISQSESNAIMGWDTNGTNLFYDNNVGIGTSEPISPLTIQTDINAIGMTQIGGEESINLATRINETSASVGTMSDHMLSLAAGGNDLFHLWPDGRVVLGQDPDPINFSGLGSSARTDPPEAKLTLETATSTSGWVHIAGDNEIIVDEAIGGVSASLGTLTDNAFRLKTNALGRLHILGDGRVTISPNDYAAQGQLTVYQPTSNVNGITAVTPNNTNGVVQIGGEGQILAMRIGGSSGSIGTWTPHIMRIVANGNAVININPITGDVGIGLPDPLANYKLSVNGNIKAKELVIETTGWPDYVFDDNHPLLPLRDVAQFIQAHRHLPNIPSAAEMENNGLAMGDMQKKMMEKIEELTLYIIQQENRIEALEQMIKK